MTMLPRRPCLASAFILLLWASLVLSQLPGYDIRPPCSSQAKCTKTLPNSSCHLGHCNCRVGYQFRITNRTKHCRPIVCTGNDDCTQGVSPSMIDQILCIKAGGKTGGGVCKCKSGQLTADSVDCVIASKTGLIITIISSVCIFLTIGALFIAWYCRGGDSNSNSGGSGLAEQETTQSVRISQAIKAAHAQKTLITGIRGSSPKTKPGKMQAASSAAAPVSASETA